ncbi:MAG: cadherin-like beta sandwich domain-containing protein, partial [Treponema sp.]|nr:cadherin-like beta sandwich domain-containing protein [Treponema sp.]
LIIAPVPAGISINSVDVIAKNPAGVQVGSTTLSSISDWSLNNWIMKCDQTYRSVYLTVIAHGVDSQTSASNAFISTKDKTSNTIWLVENIPDNGKTGIQLSTGIYDITNPYISGDNVITVKVQSEQRRAASPGEQITLDVTSHYGLKTGSLTVNGTALPGSGNQYSFVMPSQAVTLGANFFTATLGSLGIITLPSGVSVSLPDFDPDKTDYQVEVPDDVTAVIIAATAIDNATVFINGGTSPIISLDPDGDIITISVTPPAIGGGTNSSRIYTITITRTPSDP